MIGDEVFWMITANTYNKEQNSERRVQMVHSDRLYYIMEYGLQPWWTYGRKKNVTDKIDDKYCGKIVSTNKLLVQPLADNVKEFSTENVF